MQTIVELYLFGVMVLSLFACYQLAESYLEDDGSDFESNWHYIVPGWPLVFIYVLYKHLKKWIKNAQNDD